MTPEQIDMLIPHQANLRISQFIQRKFGLNDDQVYNNIMRYGNTTADPFPSLMTEAWEEGKINLEIWWSWLPLVVDLPGEVL